MSGKGASAAIYAALVTGILRSLASQELGPAEMLRALNKALLKRPIRGRFVSLIYASWDAESAFSASQMQAFLIPLLCATGKLLLSKQGECLSDYLEMRNTKR